MAAVSDSDRRCSFSAGFVCCERYSRRRRKKKRWGKNNDDGMGCVRFGLVVVVVAALACECGCGCDFVSLLVPNSNMVRLPALGVSLVSPVLPTALSLAAQLSFCLLALILTVLNISLLKVGAMLNCANSDKP